MLTDSQKETIFTTSGIEAANTISEIAERFKSEMDAIIIEHQNDFSHNASELELLDITPKHNPFNISTLLMGAASDLRSAITHKKEHLMLREKLLNLTSRVHSDMQQQAARIKQNIIASEYSKMDAKRLSDNTKNGLDEVTQAIESLNNHLQFVNPADATNTAMGMWKKFLFANGVAEGHNWFVEIEELESRVFNLHNYESSSSYHAGKSSLSSLEQAKTQIESHSARLVETKNHRQAEKDMEIEKLLKVAATAKMIKSAYLNDDGILNIKERLMSTRQLFRSAFEEAIKKLNSLDIGLAFFYQREQAIDNIDELGVEALLRKLNELNRELALYATYRQQFKVFFDIPIDDDSLDDGKLANGSAIAFAVNRTADECHAVKVNELNTSPNLNNLRVVGIGVMVPNQSNAPLTFKVTPPHQKHPSHAAFTPRSFILNHDPYPLGEADFDYHIKLVENLDPNGIWNLTVTNLPEPTAIDKITLSFILESQVA